MSIEEEYFNWLYRLACEDRFNSNISYEKLFKMLYDVEFTYIIPNDKNRAQDGLDLRYRFVVEEGLPDEVFDSICGPCSVLEMILGLSIRCEDYLMSNTEKGDRTSQWFWYMINNLGLGAMYDSRFNESLSRKIIKRFVDREYEPDGNGGLFVVRNCKEDLRDIEIWYQMCLYLETIY